MSKHSSTLSAIIVLGLAEILLAVMIGVVGLSISTTALAGTPFTDSITVIPATSNATNAQNEGIIYNNTAYLSAQLNGTAIIFTFTAGSPNCTVTALGTSSTNGTFTWAGLTKGAVYTGTISYAVPMDTTILVLAELGLVLVMIMIPISYLAIRIRLMTGKYGGYDG